MILADIGNTNIHIWENGRMYNIQKIPKFDSKVYFISVNDEKKSKFLKKNPHAVNLERFVDFDTSYTSLGIDRIMACKSVDNGIVVDAGSAVTIDVMHNGIHLGGVIMPGIYAFREAFGKISKKLDMEFCELDFFKLPQTTQEALTFGSIGAIVMMIERFKKNKKVFFTGGDGKYLARYVDGIYIKDLVFRGMIKTIKEMERK